MNSWRLLTRSLQRPLRESSPLAVVWLGEDDDYDIHWVTADHKLVDYKLYYHDASNTNGRIQYSL